MIPLADLYPCIHRGEFIETVPSQLCGDKGTPVEMFKCAVVEKCTIRRYAKFQSERFCSFCPDRKPPAKA